MKHTILVNPVSGNKRGLKYGLIIQKLLKKYNIESEIIVSNAPKHLTQIVKELSSKSIHRFYCVGGDGTLNEVISGLIGSNSDVVVIPCGTGNDFIKTVSKYKSLRKIILSSINTKSTKLDILKVGKDMYCINILSVGFDSIVGDNVNKFRNIPLISGKMKYNLAIFYSLLRNKNFNFKLRINNNIIHKRSFTLIAFANGKYYGGGVCPCPDALVNDGLLDICAINSTSIFKKILFLPFYNKGKHLKFKLVTIEKGNKATIVSNKKFPANIDGEVFYTKKLNISILEKAINVVCTK